MQNQSTTVPSGTTTSINHNLTGIAVETQVTIICDFCQETVTALRRTLEANGWGFYEGNYYLCPIHEIQVNQ